jgi:hypothetical protein
MGLNGHVKCSGVASNWEVTLPNLAQERNLAKGNYLIVLIVDGSPLIGVVVFSSKDCFKLGWKFSNSKSHAYLARMILGMFSRLFTLAHWPLFFS